jgi:SAM-dependent methyltransferase
MINPEKYQKEMQRIKNEYGRRSSEIPEGFYGNNQKGNRFNYQKRDEAVYKALNAVHYFPLEHKKILEVGCGFGSWLWRMKEWGADPKNIAGVDLDAAKIERLKRDMPQSDLRAAEASQLPWADNSFDLVMQSTLFTSVMDADLKREIASEMRRVLKPGGYILWYDFRYDNPSNKNVKGIEATEIKKLFPNAKVHLEKITLAPPIARRLAPLSMSLCGLLESIPFLRTHYLGVIQKN